MKDTSGRKLTKVGLISVKNTVLGWVAERSILALEIETS
jgi:hypothetical protein